MDPMEFSKRLMGFNKASFDNYFSALQVMQEQSARAASIFIDQANWLPGENKKAMDGWMRCYREGCEDFKNNVYQNFGKFEEFLASMQTGSAKTAEEPKTAKSKAKQS